MVRWMIWHYPPYTRFEIRTLAVWGRVHYLSVTEAPHNIESLRPSREEIFRFFDTWKPEWGSNPRSPTFQAGRVFNHCTRDTALFKRNISLFLIQMNWIRYHGVMMTWWQSIVYRVLLIRLFLMHLVVASFLRIITTSDKPTQRAQNRFA